MPGSCIIWQQDVQPPTAERACCEIVPKNLQFAAKVSNLHLHHWNQTLAKWSKRCFRVVQSTQPGQDCSYTELSFKTYNIKSANCLEHSVVIVSNQEIQKTTQEVKVSYAEAKDKKSSKLKVSNYVYYTIFESKARQYENKTQQQQQWNFSFVPTKHASKTHQHRVRRLFCISTWAWLCTCKPTLSPNTNIVAKHWLQQVM